MSSSSSSNFAVKPLASLGSSQLHHKAEIRFVLFSPDRKYVVTLSDVISTWDIETGEQIRCFSCPEGEIKNFFFAPGGQQLVVVRRAVRGLTKNIAVDVLDFETGETRLRMGEKFSQFHTVAWSPDGNMLFAVTSSHLHKNALECWSWETGTLLQRLPLHEKRRPVERIKLAVSEAALYLLEGRSYDQWTFSEQGLNPTSYSQQSLPLQDVKDEELESNSFAISTDARHAVFAISHRTSVDWQYWIRCINIQSKKIVWEKKLEQRRVIDSLNLSKDGRYLLVSSLEQTQDRGMAHGPVRVTPYRRALRTLEIETGEEYASLPSNEPTKYARPITIAEDCRLCCQLSEDGELLAFVGSGRTVLLWNLQQHDLLLPNQSGHCASIHTMAFSPDGQFLVSTASFDSPPRVWKMNDLHEHSRLSMEILEVASPTLSFGETGVVHEQDEPSGKTVEIRAVEFFPNGQQVALLLDTFVQLWKWDHWHEPLETIAFQPWNSLMPLYSGQPFLSEMKIFPDGEKIVLLDCHGFLHVWDGKTQSLSRARESMINRPTDLRRASLLPANLSPFSSRIACSQQHQRIATSSLFDDIRIWSSKDLELLATFEGFCAGKNVVCSADGSQFIGAVDQTLCIWGLPDMQLHTRLPLQTKLTSLACSANGAFWAGVGEDDSLQLWLLPELEHFQFPLPEHCRGELQWSPNNRHLAIAEETRIWIWDILDLLNHRRC